MAVWVLLPPPGQNVSCFCFLLFLYEAQSELGVAIGDTWSHVTLKREKSFRLALLPPGLFWSFPHDPSVKGGLHGLPKAYRGRISPFSSSHHLLSPAHLSNPLGTFSDRQQQNVQFRDIPVLRGKKNAVATVSGLICQCVYTHLSYW